MSGRKNLTHETLSGMPPPQWVGRFGRLATFITITSPSLASPTTKWLRQFLEISLIQTKSFQQESYQGFFPILLNLDVAIFFSNPKSLPPLLIYGWSCGQVAVIDKQTEIRSSVATNANTEHSDIGDPRV